MPRNEQAHGGVRLGGRDTWLTPRPLVRSLVSRFGRFGLDVAAEESSRVGAAWFGPGSPFGTDVLQTTPADWHLRATQHDGAIFLNPPYSMKGKVYALAAGAAVLGSVCVGIVPAALETRWFGQWVHGRAAEVWTPTRRVKFIDPATGQPGAKGPGSATLIVVWRPSWVAPPVYRRCAMEIDGRITRWGS